MAESRWLRGRIESPVLKGQAYYTYGGATVSRIITALSLVALILLLGVFFYGGMTIHELLTENRRLKEAITNLTHEDQIGYAKALEQTERDGRLFTTMLFVQTARDNPLERVLQKTYEIEGDVAHFDALIVKFDNQMVLDGKEKALYLWRRVYGETMAPADGYPIEMPGVEPVRYRDLLSGLRPSQRDLFWEEIWELANDPQRLRSYGIQGVYGNAVYSRVKPGLIYVFKISASGQVYPEVVPEL